MQDISIRFNFVNVKSVVIFFVLGVKFIKEDEFKSDADIIKMKLILYKVAVGCLIYFSVWIRVDIVKVIQEVVQFFSNSGRNYWVAVKRIYRYIE